MRAFRMIVVRYADDAVLGFPHRAEAEALREQWRERMRKFGLELHPEKTRWIECGRYAEDHRKRRAEGQPETCDCLGFTHICGRTRKGNWFTVRRPTVKPRLRNQLQAVRQELRKRWHERMAETGEWLRSVGRATSTITPCRGISRRSRRSGGRWRVRGWRRSGVAVNATAYRGSDSARSWTGIYPCRGFCIRNLGYVLTPDTQGRSRMR